MEVKRNLPENFNEDHYRYFEPNLTVTIPEPRWNFFSKKVLLLANGILINGFNVEKESLLYNTRIKDIGGIVTLFKFIIKSIATNKITWLSDHEHYITIVNEWSDNYFHWFTEAVPKLYCFLNNTKKPIILLPSNHRASFHIRTLEILGFSLKYFTHKGLVCKNLYLPCRLAPSSAQYNPVVLKQVVEKLQAGACLNINKGARIYVTRARATKRKISNENEVLLKMMALDFAVIDFEDYNLDEQISIMHHSTILVSMHGAGLTNMIFCKPGSSVLELCLKNQVMDKCYFNLANAMDMKYYYQFCDSGSNLNDYHNDDIIVNIYELEKNLHKITLEIDGGSPF